MRNFIIKKKGGGNLNQDIFVESTKISIKTLLDNLKCCVYNTANGLHA